MQKFLIEQKLLVAEWRAFRDRACVKLDWTETQLYNRMSGKTQLSTPEAIILEQVLTDLRHEVANGQLDLAAYNTGRRLI